MKGAYVVAFCLGALAMFILGKLVLFQNNPPETGFIREPSHGLIMKAIRSTLDNGCKLRSQPVYNTYADRTQTIFVVFAYAELDCPGLLGELWSKTYFLIIFEYHDGDWLVSHKAKIPADLPSWLLW